MKVIRKNGYEFFVFREGNKEVCFFTSQNEKNFNIGTELGLSNINNIKDMFNLKDIGYLKQIHSDIICEYEHGKVFDGDAIITQNKDIGIGVFTADCVPIIIIDRTKDLIASVHSGWKGTYLEITSKVLDKMINIFNSKVEDISIFIGPHIRQCCYEIGPEVIHKFQREPTYKDFSVILNNKLSLEKCIIAQCMSRGIFESNINIVEFCTYCSEEYHFHSFRKNRESNGRSFSLAFITDK